MQTPYFMRPGLPERLDTGKHPQVMSDSPLHGRRRTAEVLREIIREVVTVDIDDGELASLADALVPLRDRLAGLPRIKRDNSGLHTREHAGERYGRTPLYDRDPLIGLSNPLAPPLRDIENTDRRQWEVVFGDAYGGHPGLAHGGYVSAVLDHVLGVVAAGDGVATMTGTLTTRFLLPTPLNTRLVCHGKVDRIEGRKVFCSAVLETEREVIADADGIYIRVDPSRYG